MGHTVAFARFLVLRHSLTDTDKEQQSQKNELPSQENQVRRIPASNQWNLTRFGSDLQTLWLVLMHGSNFHRLCLHRIPVNAPETSLSTSMNDAVQEACVRSHQQRAHTRERSYAAWRLSTGEHGSRKYWKDLSSFAFSRVAPALEVLTRISTISQPSSLDTVSRLYRGFSAISKCSDRTKSPFRHWVDDLAIRAGVRRNCGLSATPLPK
ncbi:hypothetical protein SELMODRAFT_416798 [Selaginella moellendorffii]|uniref:Uncharacterized protein n=1 Tax=Selaginella moellendorffii TaxID=88036 RepID=D8S0G0_SELML|nr:hypothetical protein SELMODRAFT_416798 [Selaginella moellendorffii]